MTMMMMANQAEPLESSCTNTKYMSWVWRKGLGRDGGKRSLHTAEDGEKMSIFMLLFDWWSEEHQKAAWLVSLCPLHCKFRSHWL